MLAATTGQQVITAIVTRWFQKLSGHGPGQSAVGGPAGGMGLEHVSSKGPFPL